ncbi:16S rRNA (guanine(527)-N(7))-methyltransferase RsmG [Labilibaculum sp. DW002]|uniref:Ribosomal RNA small subunit methyltransferase G n=1 Tax=Paralabilibaculum antarcticum TaxID=2912572 RepID=A0ABT5VYQ7_9BACT|nr:16S rRNA (guanine(527)-N(7))-methyltransferase RsmG [Labilibaculum sp. DW002]MDE5420532.1 16S rRNA (guanine(527)-N(7))-methyltransferase RsmG [Labilibaculum sp. DW002]
MEILEKYFPDLSEEQREKFSKLKDLYTFWNDQINVISRKDMESLYEHHVLHSLAIAKVINFTPGTKIMDVGTGGGFPGIPLAILYPETNFYLIDSIGKKIKVVNEVAAALKLSNVKAEQIRVQQVKDKFDFIVSRAVTAFPKFVNMVRKNSKAKDQNSLPNGILYLKGGDFQDEISGYGSRISLYECSDYFTEEFFETKKVVHLDL